MSDAWIQIRAANDPSAFTISWRKHLLALSHLRHYAKGVNPR